MDNPLRLKAFVTIDELRVHNLRVEPRRMKVDYTVTQSDGRSETQEFIYSYDEKVFDPKQGTDLNLASLMAVQVAVNYGLFCQRLVFDGLYDATDKQFIREITENTSREILVNKLLIDNEFLKPAFRGLVHEKRERYTQAEIIFENSQFPSAKIETNTQEQDPDKYVILSSGGKDSLLSYGILNEIGTAVPVFVNESGRHWYSAYNAYHAMAESDPNTSRVWSNSDRMFNFMVRQMPFIRENFQNIRADIYPIRLWTVAVFLFGVLPVARKQGVKNIVIGNEYDTTMSMNHQGTTHYAALYDQSRYFDNMFSRFYQRKNWGFHQFSILRSLSELLILKILVKRYPDLQVHQTSCHAAHKEGERMAPCGNCEKCRRIVGMLSALGEDPQRCGYTPVQVEKCLHTLQAKSVKQIGTDAKHLYHLLVEGGILPKNEHTARMAKAHPEIMHLRFDNERSRLEDLPAHVREKVLPLLEEYALGSMKMRERKWESTSVQELLEAAPEYIIQAEK